MHTVNNIYNPDADIVKKLYLSLLLNNNNKYIPVHGMIDTGSDVSIASLPFLTRFFKNTKWRTNLKKDSQELYSFTETKISVIGELKLTFKLRSNAPVKTHKFIVVQDAPSSLLLGADFLQENRLNLDFSSCPPKVYANDRNEPLDSLHLASHQINRLKIMTTLKANETKAVALPLPSQLINVFPNDRILINENYNDDFVLFPTTSSQENCTVYCLISNLHNSSQEIKHDIQIEAVNAKDLVYQPKGHKNSKYLIKSPIVYNEKLNPYLTPLPQDVSKENLENENTSSETIYYIKGDDSRENFSTRQFDPAIYDKESFDEPDSPLHEDFYPQGYELPPEEIPSVSSKISEMNNSPKIDKYVRDIFQRYGKVISLYSLDVGHISKTIGTYNFSLKPNAYFPAMNRSYFIHKEKKAHMDTIIQFMIKNKIIRKANEEDIRQCRYASPCFLLSRAKKDACFRFLIDFRNLNDQIAFLPPVMPKLDELLNELRGSYYFTVIDLNQAFLQFSLDKSSQAYTRFFYNQKSYVHLRLPMGWAGSPGYFQEAIETIIDKEPVFDESGQLVYEEDGSAKLVHNPLGFTLGYMDDLICHSAFQKDVNTSLKFHFECVEKLVARLAQHSVKISLEKSKFAYTQIQYLGFLVSHNTIVCNPKRIEKLLSTPIPSNKKGLRNFLGLLCSVREYTDADVTRYMQLLSPLTSVKADFKLESKHIEAIKQIKKIMTSRPVFGYMIKKEAPKILFSDASGSSNGYLSALLTQVISTESDLPFPSYLSPSDPVHEIIISFKLPAKPLLLENERQGENKPNVIDLPTPYLQHLSHPHLGFDESDVDNSLMISLKTIQKHNKNGEVNEQLMRKEAFKYVKSKNLHLKLEEEEFSGDSIKSRTFLDEFLEGGPLDSREILIQGVAKYLKRKIFILDSTPEAKEAVIGINEELLTGAWYIGKYLHHDKVIYRPFLNVRFEAAPLDHLNKKLELISFYSKSLGPDQASKSIIELETLAIVNSLKKFEPYLRHCETTLYCDNKSFFCLFMQDSQNFSMPHKLLRYASYIRTTFPRLHMKFINSQSQLADFISRAYKTYPRQLKNIKFHEIRFSEEIDKLTPIDKSFRLEEFQDLVKQNQDKIVQYQEENKRQVLQVSFSNGTLEEKSFLDNLFNSRLSRTNIIKEQRVEFSYYINKCLISDHFTYEKDKVQYKLVNNLLMVSSHGHMAILVPESLVGYLIAYVHLKNGHAGLHGCLHNLSIYSFPNKKARVNDFLLACYSCFFVKDGNVQVKNNFLPPPDFPGQCMFSDYAQDLPNDNGYKHILIFVCGLSGLVLAFPQKSINTQSLIKDFLYNVYPLFPVETLITDNGSVYVSKEFNEVCRSLNIKKPRLSSLNPKGNKAELYVGKIKRLLKRLNVHQKQQKWLLQLPLVLRTLNTQVQSNTKLAPLHFLFGSEGYATKTSLIDKPIQKQNDMINDYSYVEARTNENKQAIEFLRKELSSAAETKIEKKPIIKHGDVVHPGDIVFVRKYYYKPGVSRALLAKFSRDPYVVLHSTDQSCIVKRLGDSFTTRYPLHLIKKYKVDDIDFARIPDSIKAILLRGFQNLTTLDLTVIRQFSPFDLPSEAITRENENSPHLQLQKQVRNDNVFPEVTAEDIIPPNSSNLKENLAQNANTPIDWSPNLEIDKDKKNKKVENNSENDEKANSSKIDKEHSLKDITFNIENDEITNALPNSNENNEIPNIESPPNSDKNISNNAPNIQHLNVHDEQNDNLSMSNNVGNQSEIGNQPNAMSESDQKRYVKLPLNTELKPPLLDNKNVILSPTENTKNVEFMPTKPQFTNTELQDEIFPILPSDPIEKAQEIKVKGPEINEQKKKAKNKPKVPKGAISRRTRLQKKLNKTNSDSSDSDPEQNEKIVSFDIEENDSE